MAYFNSLLKWVLELRWPVRASRMSNWVAWRSTGHGPVLMSWLTMRIFSFTIRWILLFTTRQRSCRKVMFSQACLILSTGGGVASLVPCPFWGRWVYLVPGPFWEWVCPRTRAWVLPPPSPHTWDLGYYGIQSTRMPTGMLSCSNEKLLCQWPGQVAIH